MASLLVAQASLVVLILCFIQTGCAISCWKCNNNVNCKTVACDPSVQSCVTIKGEDPNGDAEVNVDCNVIGNPTCDSLTNSVEAQGAKVYSCKVCNEDNCNKNKDSDDSCNEGNCEPNKPKSGATEIQPMYLMLLGLQIIIFAFQI